MRTWPKVPLGTLARFQNGFAFKPSDWDTVGRPIIRIQNLTDSGKPFNRTPRVIDQKYSVRSGDLLFAWSASLGAHIWHGENAWLNQHIFKITPSPSVERDFLFYLLQRVTHELVAKTHGSTMKHITKKPFGRTMVSLPPLDEQRRIVDILNRANGILRLRRGALDKTRQLISVLFVDMFGDPATNPKGWPVHCMASLFERKPNYGTMISPSSDRGSWLDLRVANIQGGRLDLSNRKYVELPASDAERHSLADGDLVLARAIGSREHLGKCVVVYPGREKWAFDSHLMRVRFDSSSALPEFIGALLSSAKGRSLLMQRTRQSAVQFNINTREFASVEFPLPPITKQREFRDRSSEIQATIAQQESMAETSRQLAPALMAQLFDGAASKPDALAAPA